MSAAPHASSGPRDRIAAALGGVRRLGVAYSGGVDSSVLLAAAVRILGPANVVGILAVSPSLAASERADAHAVAAVIGARIVEIETFEAERPEYRANGPDRCFHCKDELFTRIDDELAIDLDLDAIAYGENADDVQRIDRPGSRAAHEHRVLRPLADANLTKREVRALARDWGLPCADKPAAPCLASRIPHFQEVTAVKLNQVELARGAVRALVFTDVRVRHHGDTARVEFPLEDLARATAAPMHGLVLFAVYQAGFDAVTIDPKGLQSGAFTRSALRGERG